MAGEQVKQQLRELLAECEAKAECHGSLKNAAWCLAEMLQGMLSDLEASEQGVHRLRVRHVHRGEVLDRDGLEVPGVEGQGVVVPFRHGGRVQAGVRGGL